MIEKALEFAVKAHKGQTRKSTGVPYIIHPLEVSKQMAIWGLDVEKYPIEHTVALLHDVIEDCGVKFSELSEEFGRTVADMVHEMSYTGNTADGKQLFLDGFKNKAWSVHAIKVADRYCNVADFMTSDTKYAFKYLKKADKLIQDFVDREIRFYDVSNEIDLRHYVGAAKQDFNVIYSDLETINGHRYQKYTSSRTGQSKPS